MSREFSLLSTGDSDIFAHKSEIITINQEMRECCEVLKKAIIIRGTDLTYAVTTDKIIMMKSDFSQVIKETEHKISLNDLKVTCFKDFLLFVSNDKNKEI